VDLLNVMKTGNVDFKIAFRRLCDFKASLPQHDPANAPVRDLFVDREGFDIWAERYRERLTAERSVDDERAQRMKRANPVYVLRNHLAEAAIKRAQKGDYSEVQRLYTLLQRPFDEQPGFEQYADFPPDWARSIAVSCSS
jgi:uncharacterized protein YdiU (UPF0061 family)